MEKITAAVLTVSDRCFRGEAVDESGPTLVHLINNGIVKNAQVVKTQILPDSKDEISAVLKSWCDEEIGLILTTGGTGLASTDVTPEATLPIFEKVIPGITHLMLSRGLEVTPLSCLSRAVAGICKKSLIINLPGSKKASKECLEAIKSVIPHAIDLIYGQKESISIVHEGLKKKHSEVTVGGVAERQRQSPYPCLKVSEAQEMIISKFGLLIREKIMNYEEAFDHVLAEEVYSTDDHPPFDCSLKDGYAVIANEKTTVRTVVGVSCAGDSKSHLNVMLPKSCIRVNTGAAIPLGADAVVQVEDTDVHQSEFKEEVQVHLKKLPLKGQDIRRRGSDFKAGALLLPYRTHLRPAALGVLAAAGKTSVRVFDKPVVAIFSTGNELVNPGDTKKLHQVRDCNRIALASLLKDENYSVHDLGIAPDIPDELMHSLEKGFKLADVVVTTGSMSMGERDFLKEVLVADFNANIIFGRVLMKPGKPTACADLMYEGKRKLWFGLPGNPASAMVSAQLFLLPTLRAISGREKVFPVKINSILREKICIEDRPQFVRASMSYVSEMWYANITGNQMSSRIGSCLNASGLVIIPSLEESYTKSITSDVIGPNSSVETLLIDKIFV